MHVIMVGLTRIHVSRNGYGSSGLNLVYSGKNGVNHPGDPGL